MIKKINSTIESNTNAFTTKEMIIGNIANLNGITQEELSSILAKDIFSDEELELLKKIAKLLSLDWEETKTEAYDMNMQEINELRQQAEQSLVILNEEIKRLDALGEDFSNLTKIRANYLLEKTSFNVEELIKAANSIKSNEEQFEEENVSHGQNENASIIEVSTPENASNDEEILLDDVIEITEHDVKTCNVCGFGVDIKGKEKSLCKNKECAGVSPYYADQVIKSKSRNALIEIINGRRQELNLNLITLEEEDVKEDEQVEAYDNEQDYIDDVKQDEEQEENKTEDVVEKQDTKDKEVKKETKAAAKASTFTFNFNLPDLKLIDRFLKSDDPYVLRIAKNVDTTLFLDENKTPEEMMEYIKNNAKNMQKNGVAMVNDEDVYQWAKDYLMNV